MRQIPQRRVKMLPWGMLLLCRSLIVHPYRQIQRIRRQPPHRGQISLQDTHCLNVQKTLQAGEDHICGWVEPVVGAHMTCQAER